MAPFRFSLDALLRLRKREKEMAELEFSQAVEGLLAAKRKRDELARDIRNGRDGCDEALSGGISASAYLAAIEYVEALTARMREAERELNGNEAGVAAKRHALVERKRAAELVERLEVRAYDRFLQEEEGRLQAEADDLAAVRYARVRTGPD